MKPQTILPFLLLLMLILAGCERDAATMPAEPDPADLDGDYVETGDLDAINGRGILRILVHREDSGYLPRDGYPADIERRLAQDFARARGLEPVLVAVEDYGELIEKLLAGHGDVVAANMTVTTARAEQVAFSVGVDSTREMIVGRAGGPVANDIEDLRGHSVGVIRGTTFWEAAEERLAGEPDIEIHELPGTTGNDQVLDAVVAGDYDFAIQDSNVLDVVETYRGDIVSGFALGERRPLAWAVRPDNPELLDALNRFLTRERLTRADTEDHTDDLDGIRERRVLRVLTRNNATTYYLYRGELVGFEYQMAKRFADQLGVRLQMVVADDHEQLIPMLKDGRGDMIAAFFTRTEERERQGVRFSRPYHYATETVVGRARDDVLESPGELAGRTLHLREVSSYWQTARALQEAGIEVELAPVPADMETEQIIAGVGEGEFDLTIADSHILESEMTVRDDIHGLLDLGEEVAHGWVVREDNPALLAAINSFWDEEYRGLYYNILYRRYFRDDTRMRAHRAGRIEMTGEGQLSDWDDLTRRYAAEYDFDWRLILSQMYQESRFDPEAVSWVGAMGLMQIMPRTAEEIGLLPVTDPEIGIHAGIKYMDWLRERFPDHLPVDERTWFSLAAYNAGIGHVRDARRLAAMQGLDPDRWFGNVEEAILLLSDPQYHRQARYGFVRGREPYNYVRHIRDRYRVYTELVEE